MYSMTMHILGALVDAAMNSTTLGCRSAVITRTYCWSHLVFILDIFIIYFIYIYYLII